MGVALRKVNESEAAVTHLEAALQTDPTGTASSGVGAVWEHLGATLMKLEKFQEATVAYERAVALDPANQKVLKGLQKAQSKVEPPLPEVLVD